MILSLTSMLLLGWVCAWPGAAAAADSDVKLTSKVGEDVTLKPAPTSDPITSIIWKHNQNIASEWDAISNTVDQYSQFKDRCEMNTATGELTISRLTVNDMGVYTAEVNNRLQAQKFNLVVLYPVPKPTVIKVCDTGGAGCVLMCEGNTTGAEPVTYKWKSGGTEKNKDITKDDHVDTKNFICELKNEVSQETSDAVFNPFYKEDDIEPVDGVRISTGVTVFICLLSAVLVLVFVHRWKAGAWFFQKESLPYEADFWRKQDRQPRDTAESNGTTSHQEQQHTDEESPMNKQP